MAVVATRQSISSNLKKVWLEFATLRKLQKKKSRGAAYHLVGAKLTDLIPGLSQQAQLRCPEVNRRMLTKFVRTLREKRPIEKWLLDEVDIVLTDLDMAVLELPDDNPPFPPAAPAALAAEPAQPTAAAPAGAGKTFTLLDLKELTGLENAALIKYTRMAQVRPAGRGKRNHRFTADEVKAVVQKIIEVSTQKLTRETCKAALAALEVID